jgi:integrase
MPFANVDGARVRWFTKDECARLLNACPPDFRRLVRAALLTGCRYGELYRLEMGYLKLDAGTLHIREAKSGRARHIHLDEEAPAFFRAATAAL